MPAENCDSASRGESSELSARLDLPPRNRVAAGQANLTKKPTLTFFRPILAPLLLTTSLAGAPWFALAQNAQSDGSAAARAGAIEHAQKMRRLFRAGLSPPSNREALRKQRRTHSFKASEPTGARATPAISLIREWLSVLSMCRSYFMRTPMTRYSASWTARPVLPTTSRHTGRSARPIVCCSHEA